MRTSLSVMRSTLVLRRGGNSRGLSSRRSTALELLGLVREGAGWPKEVVSKKELARLAAFTVLRASGHRDGRVHQVLHQAGPLMSPAM